ncbi:hypothetical protein LCGC14_1097860 [marine sediment metagenome]|uniref:Uncharacterized protein n=1 Tax=marine sediment metagenome TaxID=412755 RepID=A0A0F9QGH5_9ZZZZ
MAGEYLKEMDKEIILSRWSPKKLSVSDIMNIIQKYGTNNDSLLEEEYGENTAHWRITIEVNEI